MNELSFINETKTAMVEWENLYNDLFTTTLAELRINGNTSLTINWVDKPKALELNQKYRSQNYVPDVLSFPLEMEKELAEVTGEKELGDLIICYDVAIQKADKYHHQLDVEMAFLFVHGLLHLLGYDHELSLKDEEEMFKLQDKILKAHNIRYDVIYDDEDYL